MITPVNNSIDSKYKKGDYSSQNFGAKNSLKPTNNITFKGNLASEFFSFGREILFSNKLHRAKNELVRQKINISREFMFSGDFKLSDFDIDKLEGLQHNIKALKGLSLKESLVAVSGIRNIMTKRGCSGKCSHCIVSATPMSANNKDNLLTEMSHEDFSSILDAYKELKSRFGFEIKNWFNHHTNFFYDANGIDIAIKDKSGKIYEYQDLGKEYYEKIGTSLNFDTIPWNPKNTKLQQRAQRFVDFAADEENKKVFGTIHLSFNPFGGIYNRALESKLNLNEEKYQKFFNLYAKQAANAIFTFSPLLKNRNFRFILRINEADTNTNIEAMKSIFDKTALNLYELYTNDYNTIQKYVKTPHQIDDMLAGFFSRTSERFYTNIYPMGRAEKYQGLVDFPNQSAKNLYDNNHIKKSIDLYKLYDSGIFSSIDANGDVYLTNGGLNIPTDIKLNFINKNRKTPEVKLQTDFKLTKEDINKKFK